MIVKLCSWRTGDYRYVEITLAEWERLADGVGASPVGMSIVARGMAKRYRGLLREIVKRPAVGPRISRQIWIG
jgi:hypothetical protein